LASSAALIPRDFVRQEAAALSVPASGIKPCCWTSFDRPERRAEWDALAARAVEPNPFFESWYLLPGLRAFDPELGCTILRFERGGQLAGLMPVIRPSKYYRWPIPHLASWIHSNCFLGAPLVAPGAERVFWEHVLDWADNAGGKALFLHLADLPLGGPLAIALRETCESQRRPAALVHREERAMLASTQCPEAYFEQSLSSKKRKELRRQFARLSELGKVAVTRNRDGRGLAKWTEQFLALEHSGWKGAAGSALASHHTTSELFRAALAGAAGQGKLERLTLSLDREPIAMLATFLTPPGAFSYKTAFDERFARFSPGVLLQRENLQVLSDRRIRWSDSCAASDHPMIDRIWRERRAIGRFSIAIGGPARRLAFRQLLRAELRRNPTGLVA
jgi:CelD/BcsL family acetyltransferase involved in cellulose biosynthesis